MDTLITGATRPDPGYDELVAESLALIPLHAPEWTNHNASDPGITIVELLAYFTDLMLYRVGRSGAASRTEFLRLLRGGGLGSLAGAVHPDPAAVREAIEVTVDEISRIDTAVTPLDHESLAQAAMAALPWGNASLVRCLARTDLTRSARHAEDFEPGQDTGHTSLVVFPPPDCPPQALQALLDAVRRALEPRRLLGSRLAVVPPVTLHLGLKLWATAAAGADRVALAARVAEALEHWQPAASSTGAPTSLSLSEMAVRAAEVEQVEGVDDLAVVQIGLRGDDLYADDAAIGLQIGLHSTVGRDSRLGAIPGLTRRRLVRDGSGELSALMLRPWEVPRLVLRPSDIAWSDRAPRSRILR